MGPHLGPVADVLGTMRIVEGTERLVLALHGRSNGGNDAGLGAAAEAVAQQPRQLGVAVGHVRGLLHQRGDHAAERQQRLVDQPGLLCPRIHRPRPAIPQKSYSFTALPLLYGGGDSCSGRIIAMAFPMTWQHVYALCARSAHPNDGIHRLVVHLLTFSEPARSTR